MISGLVPRERTCFGFVIPERHAEASARSSW